MALGLAALAPGRVPAVEVAPAIEYQADADCPAREQFLMLVRGALEVSAEAAERVPSRDSNLRIRVGIRAVEAGGFEGAMERIDRGASSAPRVITGSRCDEVAQALALTVAFSVVADRETAGAAAKAAVTALPAGKAAAAAKATGTSLARPRSVSAPSTTVEGAAGRPAEWGWQGAVGATAGGWLSPDVLLGLEASVGVRSMGAAGRRPPLGWGVRLRTTYARNDWRGDDLVARFGMLATALDLCALGDLGARHVEVGLCAGVEVGWLRGRGLHIASPRATNSLWLALGGGPVVSLPLFGSWQIEVRGAVERSLRQVRFTFDAPAQLVAGTRSVVWIGGVALVARLP